MEAYFEVTTPLDIFHDLHSVSEDCWCVPTLLDNKIIHRHQRRLGRAGDMITGWVVLNPAKIKERVMSHNIKSMKHA